MKGVLRLLGTILVLFWLCRLTLLVLGFKSDMFINIASVLGSIILPSVIVKDNDENNEGHNS